jgi:hypothetical protein
MSAFESVLKAVNRWQCEPLPKESKYRDALTTYLREELKDAKVEPEYRHLGTTTDIFVKQAGFFGSSEVFVELKRNLNSKTEFDRLVGQIEGLEPKKNFIIVVLCGETKPGLLARLQEKYKVPPPHTYKVYRQQFEVIAKEHLTREPTLKRKRADSERHNETRALIELHKRRILSTRVANNYYPELSRLRETFLQYGLADRNAANRKFFEKWLTDPVVEMRWAPAGGWTIARITELYADIESLKG